MGLERLKAPEERRYTADQIVAALKQALESSREYPIDQWSPGALKSVYFTSGDDYFIIEEFQGVAGEGITHNSYRIWHYSMKTGEWAAPAYMDWSCMSSPGRSAQCASTQDNAILKALMAVFGYK